jgi:hypothetical protein
MKKTCGAGGALAMGRARPGARPSFARIDKAGALSHSVQAKKFPIFRNLA